MASEFLETSSELVEKRHINPRAAFYKKPIRRENYKLDSPDEESPQEIRRQRLLCEQKKNRDTQFNISRGILEEISNEDEENEEEMEVGNEKRRRSRNKRRYANQLMMSEWMLEVPLDLSEKWLMVPCPQGQRTLVIAYQGTTAAYNKRGMRLGVFRSDLPGGSSEEQRGSCTILDCIWERETRTYYALDVLAWSNHPFLNCDAEFRFFWLTAQLKEAQGLKERGSRVNSFPILPLPNISCDMNISEFMSSLPSLPLIDGLLFYHREAHYKRGRTPLVTWLKPFMLPEVLGISISPPFDEKPDGYIDLRHYIQTHKVKGKKKEAADDSMETANIDA